VRPTAAAEPKPTHSESHDDEITIERRVRLPAAVAAMAAQLTRQMPVIDEKLLAIARGDLEPDDPFGGLIPIYDNDNDIDCDDEAHMPEGMFGDVVPLLRMRTHQILELTLSDECRFFASQVDGKRTVDQLIDVCGFDDLEGLETIDELLRVGVLELTS
jgi:hypothetical protein